ncbi:hypothetical protein EX30DRAFT_180996 [Ascodesmis nigricans]|uniref:Uncharacterized protein n=1 Tax=Ascodesmis nigricans TaxID=341454 RepID=A0A4S2ML10_9PEZI|nr:hypothetical protein EX30DRAFT_180996 [Ascodesmis nigricans]
MAMTHDQRKNTRRPSPLNQAALAAWHLADAEVVWWTDAMDDRCSRFGGEGVIWPGWWVSAGRKMRLLEMGDGVCRLRCACWCVGEDRTWAKASLGQSSSCRRASSVWRRGSFRSRRRAILTVTIDRCNSNWTGRGLTGDMGQFTKGLVSVCCPGDQVPRPRLTLTARGGGVIACEAGSLVE